MSSNTACVLPQRVDHIKDLVIKKINDTLDSESEKIPIAFKFSDGVKREHTFSQSSTVTVCIIELMILDV